MPSAFYSNKGLNMFRVPPALKHRNFTLIWLGLMISMVGTQMQQWALFWHISQLSKDPIAVRDRKSTRLNSSHIQKSRMPSSA